MCSCVNGKVFGNMLFDIWYDGIYVIKVSVDIMIMNNEVINGGDDVFVVVGYFNEGVWFCWIMIVNNWVVGIKYVCGIVIVGVQDIIVVDNQIYNLMVVGIYVVLELMSVYQLYGNDNVMVVNNFLDMCGV